MAQETWWETVWHGKEQELSRLSKSRPRPPRGQPLFEARLFAASLLEASLPHPTSLAVPAWGGPACNEWGPTYNEFYSSVGEQNIVINTQNSWGSSPRAAGVSDKW